MDLRKKKQKETIARVISPWKPVYLEQEAQSLLTSMSSGSERDEPVALTNQVQPANHLSLSIHEKRQPRISMNTLRYVLPILILVGPHRGQPVGHARMHI